MATLPDRLSYSQIREWQRCRYSYSLRYLERLKTKTLEATPARGSMVHKGISAMLAGESAEGAVRQWMADWLQRYGLAEEAVLVAQYEIIVEEAIAVLAKFDRDQRLDRWEPLPHPVTGKPMVDTEIVVPLEGWPGGFVQYLDMVARDRETGQNWLVDFKLRGSFTSMEAEETNVQMPIYQHGLRLIGVDTVGSMAYQIRKTAPAEPKQNLPNKKTGVAAMSRAKIASDWFTYRNALLAVGLEPKDYEEEMRPKLGSVRFTELSSSFRTPREVEETWNQIVLPASTDILLNVGTAYRHLSPINCRSCWARDLCLERLRGRDTEFIEEHQFERKEES